MYKNVLNNTVNYIYKMHRNIYYDSEIIAPPDALRSSLLSLTAVGPLHSFAHGGAAHAHFHKSLYNQFKCYFLCSVSYVRLDVLHIYNHSVSLITIPPTHTSFHAFPQL